MTDDQLDAALALFRWQQDLEAPSSDGDEGAGL